MSLKIREEAYRQKSACKMWTTDSLEINLLTVGNSSQLVSQLVRWACSFVSFQLSTYLLILDCFSNWAYSWSLTLTKLICAEGKDHQT